MKNLTMTTTGFGLQFISEDSGVTVYRIAKHRDGTKAPPASMMLVGWVSVTREFISLDTEETMEALGEPLSKGRVFAFRMLIAAILCCAVVGFLSLAGTIVDLF